VVVFALPWKASICHSPTVTGHLPLIKSAQWLQPLHLITKHLSHKCTLSPYRPPVNSRKYCFCCIIFSSTNAGVQSLIPPLQRSIPIFCLSKINCSTHGLGQLAQETIQVQLGFTHFGSVIASFPYLSIYIQIFNDTTRATLYLCL